jgi:hypothetical protein
VRSQERFMETAAQNTLRRLKEKPAAPAAYATTAPLLDQHPRQRQAV